MIIDAVTRTYVSTPPLHPDHPERGRRHMEVRPTDGKATVLVSDNDVQGLEKGRLVRLLELFNVEISSKAPSKVEACFRSDAYEDARKAQAPLYQWLPIEDNIRVSLLMTDGHNTEGLGETAISSLETGEMIQLVRTGFGRVEAKTTEAVNIVYAHS